MNNLFIKNLWRWKCGFSEVENNSSKLTYSELRQTEWSSEFEELMRNRLIMGAFRYGRLHVKGKKEYDRIKSICHRIVEYEITGNKEYLVDVANLCLLEFEECKHPLQHFEAVDDGKHVDIK